MKEKRKNPISEPTKIMAISRFCGVLFEQISGGSKFIVIDSPAR